MLEIFKIKKVLMKIFNKIRLKKLMKIFNKIRLKKLM